MALEAYQLAIGLAQQLGEAHSCASFLCQSASLLLDVGTPEIALVILCHSSWKLFELSQSILVFNMFKNNTFSKLSGPN